MARAKYFDGSSYKDWTADMVGGLSVDGTHNIGVNINSPDKNPIGYYLVAKKTFTFAWTNTRALWMITNRHDGNGIVSISTGCYSTNTDIYASIYLFTTYQELKTQNIIGVIHDNMFEIYAHIQDYESLIITPLLYNYDTDLKPYMGDWVTTLPSGTQVPARINGQQIYVQSSAPTDDNAVLWIQT